MKEDDDWKVGDVAVCIWKKPCDDGLEVGRYYTVTDVIRFPDGMLGLGIKELPTVNGMSWTADRFRKVRPAEDVEFVAQMKRLRDRTPEHAQ